ncbi:MAG: fibronectin type III domain-containing protein, partial [Chitinophagales bacterium]
MKYCFLIFLFFLEISLNAQVPGSLDLTFKSGWFANGTVRCTAVQPDGKIIVAGEFTTFNNYSRNHIVRLNPDFSVDETFDPGLGADKPIYAILLSGKKILITGDFYNYNGTARKGIAGLNGNGTLDMSFDPGIGLGTFSVCLFIQTFSGLALEKAGDGKYYVGGEFISYNGISRKGIARINNDGSLDLTFNPGSGLSGNGLDDCYAAVDPDVAGVYSIAKTIDDKIIIGGHFSKYNAVVRNNIARINSDGSLDNTFTTSVAGPIYDAGVYSLDISPSGKIYAGGRFTTVNGIYGSGIARINSDGSYDNSFATDSGFTALYGSFVYDLELLAENKLMVAGYFDHYGNNIADDIIRLNDDGSIDTTFSNLESSSRIYTLTKQADGKYIVGGYFNYLGGTHIDRIARLEYNGILDNTIANEGESGVTSDASFEITKRSPDGNIYSTCAFIDNSGLIKKLNRVNSDGSTDPTFNPEIDIDYDVFDFDFQYDGQLLVLEAKPPYYKLERMNPDGTIDPSFNDGSGTNATIAEVRVLPDNSVLICGYFSVVQGITQKYLAKLHADGSVDNTFHPLITGSYIKRIAVQQDGKIIIHGMITSINGTPVQNTARLNTDGTLDLSFTAHITRPYYFHTSNFNFLSDNSIIVSGDFTSVNGISKNNLVKLHNDGSIDESFLLTTGFAGLYQTLEDVKIDSVDRIICAGSFTSYNGINSNGLVRINANGSFDTTFIVGNGTLGMITNVCLDSDENIIVNGNLADFDLTTRDRIAKIFGGSFSCEPPATLNAINITATTAKIKWSSVTGADQYHLQYRVLGTIIWTDRYTANLFKKINGLIPATTYEYRVSTNCDAAASNWTPINTFSTPARLGQDDENIVLVLFPNPNNGSFSIEANGLTGNNIKVEIFDICGSNVFTADYGNQGGIFYQKIILQNNIHGVLL